MDGSVVSFYVDVQTLSAFGLFSFPVACNVHYLFSMAFSSAQPVLIGSQKYDRIDVDDLSATAYLIHIRSIFLTYCDR